MSNTIEKKFVEEIKELLNSAKEQVKTSINLAMVYTYYEIGRRIVNHEQNGKNRADYGKEILKNLSNELTKEFGKGYSVDNLKLMRRFFLIYKNDQIGESVIPKSDLLPKTLEGRSFYLGWTQYVKIMALSNKNERHFYEIECAANSWSIRELKRQIDSCLYERLALSRDKEAVMELSQKGQVIEKPMDAIKDPYILNFLELREEERFSEKDLENRIINKLQDFLLELGKGFTFVKRQMRLTFDDQHFYADLVFYNRLLKCFVVIDLKTKSLTHQDIGQMQMYVNYFDRHVKLPDENKTIGILLCKEKNDAVVELTLPIDNDSIFASKYEMVLPTKEELIEVIKDK